jgi:hypothetical protein
MSSIMRRRNGLFASSVMGVPPPAPSTGPSKLRLQRPMGERLEPTDLANLLKGRYLRQARQAPFRRLRQQSQAAP